MRDPNVLGVVAIPTTDDASLVEADDVSVVLPRFWPLCFILKTPKKHPRNHDKPNHGLKKPKNQTQPETKNKLELRYVFFTNY